MAEKLDWLEIQSAFYGISNPSSFTLSLEGVKLLLVLLNDRAIHRGAWVVGSDLPSGSEWDDIQEFVSGTMNSLFSEGADMEMCILEDQKTSGTGGGTFTSGAWRTRDLNVEVFDDIGVTLSSNEFVLPIGKFLISANPIAYRVNHHRSRLYNVSDSSVEIEGVNTFSHTTHAAQVPAHLAGIVDISSSKTFRIEHRCSSTLTGGFGVAVGGSFTVPYEVYTRVVITRI